MIFEISLLSIIMCCVTLVSCVCLIINKERMAKDLEYKEILKENENLKNDLDLKDKLFKEREKLLDQKEKMFQIINKERASHVEEIKNMTLSLNPNADHKKDLKDITNRFFDVAEKNSERNMHFNCDKKYFNIEGL
jgi:hypothetical protein